jgi:hypothetical protein
MSGLWATCPDDGLEGKGTASVEVEELGLSAGDVMGEGAKIDLLAPPVTGSVESLEVDGWGLRCWLTLLFCMLSPPRASRRRTRSCLCCCWSPFTCNKV